MSRASDLPGEAAPAITQVTAATANQVTELFALAFHDDPTWSWAFPDRERRLEQHRVW